MSTKTMCFKAPMELHKRIEDVVNGDPLTINKQAFLVLAVMEKLNRDEKKNKK